jgi:hypothetical protein
MKNSAKQITSYRLKAARKIRGELKPGETALLTDDEFDREMERLEADCKVGNK